jgi:hypothetical protein
MVLRLRAQMEHLRYRGSLSCLPSPMDYDPVPLVQPVVSAFRLVCEVI